MKVSEAYLLWVRPLIFFITIILCLTAEILRPEFKHDYKSRVKTNILLLLFSILILKIAFPYGLYALTESTNSESSFLFLKSLPWYLDAIITILIFDLIIYWQHRLFHTIPWLWRFHEVHHSDKSMDLSMAVRFHPGEIVLSGLLKTVILMVLVPRLEVFLVYESILSSMAIFNHSNIHIPPRVEKWLRYLIVTPQMHNPHHSPIKELTNSNYGNFLSIWDRLFKSFTNESNNSFGLDQVSKNQADSILHQLALPFQPRLKE